MAKTLLNVVNEILTNTRHISGTDGAITSLTDSARQIWIDGATKAANDTLKTLYSHSRQPLPKMGRIKDLVLVEDKRTYALDSGVIEIKWPLRDEENGDIVRQHPKGYYGILDEQLQPGLYTGFPYFCAIEPTRGDMYFDRIPTSSEAGRILKMHYRTRYSLVGAGDIFPFNDDAVDGLVQSATEVFKRRYQNDFDNAFYLDGMSKAAAAMTGSFSKAKW